MGNTYSIPSFSKPCLETKSFAVSSWRFNQSFPNAKAARLGGFFDSNLHCSLVLRQHQPASGQKGTGHAAIPGKSRTRDHTEEGVGAFHQPCIFQTLHIQL